MATDFRGAPIQLLVFGATGRTGRHVVRQARARGHDVTAVGRRAGAFAASENVHEVIADPL